MADNVAITAGSGTDVATDQVSGTNEHVQVVKLAIAADGSRVALPGDATDGLLVNLGSNNDGVVTATDLDIRNLVLANDAVKVGDGTSLIDIDTAPTDGETNGGSACCTPRPGCGASTAGHGTACAATRPTASTSTSPASAAASRSRRRRPRI